MSFVLIAIMTSSSLLQQRKSK